MTGTWILFFHILRIIIPIDFHIFQRGSNHQPENVYDIAIPTLGWMVYRCKITLFHWKSKFLMGKSQCSKGKINYFDWAIFHSYFLWLSSGCEGEKKYPYSRFPVKEYPVVVNGEINKGWWFIDVRSPFFMEEYHYSWTIASFNGYGLSLWMEA